MKFTLVLVLLAALFLSGCERKYFDHYFKEHLHTEAVMNNLKNARIKKDDETKVLFQALYLNRVNPEKFNDGEYFFVGLYIKDEVADAPHQGLNSMANRLTLNGTTPERLSTLDKTDELRKAMPFISEWNQYYLVRFESMEFRHCDVAFETCRAAIDISALSKAAYEEQTQSCTTQRTRCEGAILDITFESDRYGKAQLTFSADRSSL